ncbi:gamma-glutamylcyclotransferase family protein [Streptomyces lasiicapitis]|uniref:gamma-glutamylcyclotransferase family protein n=1 Tax=Streptomyces lasiicapitis TaxID=1923961 RepID=UPI0033176EF5
MTPPAEHLPVFVYGTLRPGERNHAAYLRGRITSTTPACLQHTLLYDGPGYPYAVETTELALVHGDLITPIPAEYESLLAALDHLEDYSPGDPRNLYERVAREVRCEDGTRRRAWVYVAAPRLAARLRATGSLLPEGKWQLPARPDPARPAFEDEREAR